MVFNAEVRRVSQTSAPKSERRSSRKNSLTGPTLLEMSGYAYQELTTLPQRSASSTGRANQVSGITKKSSQSDLSASAFSALFSCVAVVVCEFLQGRTVS